MSLFGIGAQKPRHYTEMVKVAWENRDQLPFAWRILSRGVCDGCALGTSGLSDWTLPGTHLCMVRLELMRLNTAPALAPVLLADAAGLASRSSRDLRALGRLPEPMLRCAGERGFRVVTWDDALTRIAREARAVDPQRMAFYLTSRGVTNEVYYAAQKAARFLGTNHVDNSARLCHAASTVAMKAMLGHAASTCSYADWLYADLIVLFGSNVANNQPVTTKYLHRAKRNGAQIAVVNPFREPGLERYWIPSIAASALNGTALADHWFEVHTGGDLAFLLGVLLALVDRGGIDEAFVGAQHHRLRAGLRQGGGGRVGPHRARQRHVPRAHRRVRRPAGDAPQGCVRVVDGPHAARARRRHGEGAGQRRPGSRPVGAPALRSRADPRPLGRAGRRRSRLRATPGRRGTRRAWNARGAFRCRRRTGGRRAR